jgi:hypothetical protein
MVALGAVSEVRLMLGTSLTVGVPPAEAGEVVDGEGEVVDCEEAGPSARRLAVAASTSA